MPGTDQHTAPNERAEDHALLCKAVREAGALALTYYKADAKHWEKSKGDPVSEADLAVNALLAERLQDARPGYGWLSEETEDDARRLTRTRVWVIDPIDGTRAFIKGKPHFTICGALVEEGRPVLGAVFNPAMDEFFEAVSGGGARLNGAPIQVSACDAIDGCRMAAFGPMFKHPAWREPWPEMEIVDRNSVAYRLALVACGQADAAMALNRKNDWDIAAADLLIHEAGGKVTDHQGAPLIYNREDTKHRSFIAAGPALYQAIIARTGKITLP
ncbi:inositol-phosphate phosphatase [Tepidicaulis marinus]|mgnify:CR=1 FL=1|uniref:Inositol-phosphate phosphatase n=1 Tax=Tepidicaulis marinus TaxID=1333998 RepID=A0A081BAC7_9HYPH|nr:3'(2'),5'-bisphosphate nucleotidase CysQ [Tepidicaulis marinus]GAK44995.1 inositol-phosphate phosphatase [Tepidicaulis marinus]